MRFQLVTRGSVTGLVVVLRPHEGPLLSRVFAHCLQASKRISPYFVASLCEHTHMGPLLLVALHHHQVSHPHGSLILVLLSIWFHIRLSCPLCQFLAHLILFRLQMVLLFLLLDGGRYFDSFLLCSLCFACSVTLQLMFTVILLITVVVIISFLKLSHIVFRIFLQGFWWGLGRHQDSHHLWELDWLRLPQSTLDSKPSNSSAIIFVAYSTATFKQWRHHLGHLLGSRLPKLVDSSVLGPCSSLYRLQAM
jgi:hypothetical protein